MPKCALISIYKPFDIAPNILYTILFIVNCNESISAELRLNFTTRARPDPTGPARTRVSDKVRGLCLVGSGWARVVEFSYYEEGLYERPKRSAAGLGGGDRAAETGPFIFGRRRCFVSSDPTSRRHDATRRDATTPSRQIRGFVGGVANKLPSSPVRAPFDLTAAVQPGPDFQNFLSRS